MRTNIVWAVICMAVVSGAYACGGKSSSNSTPLTTTYSISGTVTSSSSTGLQGVTVTLGGSATATTDASGNYSFAGLVNGSYTVTPSNAGYTFSPTSRIIVVDAADVTAVNFSGAELPQPNATCTDEQLSQLEQSMTSTLTGTTTDTDFTLMLQSADGRTYSYSTGLSTSTTSYASASTSKLVTAVVILSLIDQGITTLTLDSKPQDLISFWTPTTGNPASGITLRHLLNFTSGFWNEPLCLNSGLADYNTCVQNIYNTNINNDIAPGSNFYYSGTHLQIAGLMAINAGGYSSWTAVFNDFKTRSGLFSHSTYDLPSSTNPTLAGGMHWTAEDYLAFLYALYSGQILSANMRAELWSNQRGAALVVNSPIVTAMGEDWAYGLGNWVECKSPVFNCRSSLQRNSSPGAYGAYPFIDFENKYYGILARQGALGTLQNGINLFRTVETSATKWATRSCGN